MLSPDPMTLQIFPKILLTQDEFKLKLSWIERNLGKETGNWRKWKAGLHKNTTNLYYIFFQGKWGRIKQGEKLIYFFSV